MKVRLQAVDFRIIAELMANNNTYDRRNQLKGMLEDLQRITSAVQGFLIEETKKEDE